MSHLRAPDGTVLCEHPEPHNEDLSALRLVDDEHEHEHDHDHSHGLVDRSILRSRAGIKAVSLSLAVLTLTAVAQAFIYSRTLSVALLADLIHNFGDALTAIPLGLAFFFRSLRGERLAGLAVVLAIFISAMVALYQTIERFIHPRTLSHLWLLALAGIIGFIGNEIAAQVRLRAGHRLQKPRPGRRRQARPCRRVRQPWRTRKRHLRRSRPAASRSDHRPRHHAAHPPHHLGELADDRKDPTGRDARPTRLIVEGCARSSSRSGHVRPRRRLAVSDARAAERARVARAGVGEADRVVRA